MNRSISLSLAALAFSFALNTQAQGTVDIGLFHEENGQLAVKVRPSADFDGIFSSVVFTLRWDKNTDITLGDAIVPEHAPLSTRRSGGQRESGTFNYMVYAGFGFEPMSASGARWTAGEEYTILTIPVTGKGTVELMNDEWTGATLNNGDFYASLGGHDKTGTIYKAVATTTDMDGTVSIKPNPNEGVFQFSFFSDEEADIRVEVVNSLGQSSFMDNLRKYSGLYVHDMDLTQMTEGVYYLKITRAGKTSVHKIAYQ